MKREWEFCSSRNKRRCRRPRNLKYMKKEKKIFHSLRKDFLK